jgi:uncharacterized membrane protein HdeD (DUF308 family)
MTTTTDPRTAANVVRTSLGIAGVLALIVGVLILVWPAKTATGVTALIAIYAIAAGLVYAGIGIFVRGKGGWSRAGHIVLGLVFVLAGVIAFTNLAQTKAWLAVFLGLVVGIMWIVEGIVALSSLRDSSSKGWSVFFAIVSIAAGITLLFSPVWGAVVLWWLLGISLIVLGVINIVRAFSFGRQRA